MVVKGRLHSIGLFLPVGYAKLMRPNKAETAVHGCHCPGDMAVRMLDRGLVFECVTCFDCLKGVTFMKLLLLLLLLSIVSNMCQFPSQKKTG